MRQISPLGIVGWIVSTGIAAFVLYYALKTYKINYTKPCVKIKKSYATPGDFPSKIELEISNRSKFENTICCFRIFSLSSFRLINVVAEKEIGIKLPATSKINADISLGFEDVKNLRGRKAILCFTDLKGLKIKKRFVFMPSFDRKKLKKATKYPRNNL